MSSPIMKDEKITLADFIVDYADAITAIISKVVKKRYPFPNFIISFDIYYYISKIIYSTPEYTNIFIKRRKSS